MKGLARGTNTEGLELATRQAQNGPGLFDEVLSCFSRDERPKSQRTKHVKRRELQPPAAPDPKSSLPSPNPSPTSPTHTHREPKDQDVTGT